MTAPNITVEPWPLYSEDGGPPTWKVRVVTEKRAFDARWSCRLGRFAKSWSAMHLRRSQPTAFRQAVQFMRDFCSGMGQTRVNP